MCLSCSCSQDPSSQQINQHFRKSDALVSQKVVSEENKIVSTEFFG